MITTAYQPRKEDVQRIENDFTFHPAAQGTDQGERYDLIRRLGKNLATELMGMCPSSRELSVALTKLNEVVFWANAAIARNESGAK